MKDAIFNSGTWKPYELSKIAASRKRQYYAATILKMRILTRSQSLDLYKNKKNGY